MEFRHIHIPAMIIAVIIGYELCYYFLYKYFKSKDEGLKLNKILLAFGVLYGFLVTSIFLRLINNYYITQPFVNDLFSKLIILTFLLGFILLLIDLSKDFEEITLPIITKLLIILNLIPFITIFIFPIESIEFRLSLLPNTITLLYILYININLIKKSTGGIKRRLKLILFSEFLVAFGVIIGGEDTGLNIDTQYLEAIYMIAILFSIVGMLIVFIGIYDFPAFFEFDWRENLICLYVMDKTNYKLLYSFDFLSHLNGNNQMDLTTKDKSLIFFKGIIGIEEVAHLITKSEAKDVEKIKQGEILILLSHGDNPISKIVYILLVKKEMNSFHYILKTIKKNFQDFYKSIIVNIESIEGKEENFFLSFDNNLKSILAIH